MEHTQAERKRARYKVTEENGGRTFTFLCDLSGAVLRKTEPICEADPSEEYELAWSSAKPYINSCHKCGRNVIDSLYNAETMECVKCSPWQKTPVYCADCGAKLSENDLYCAVCGKRIRREGVDDDADG